MLFETTTFDCSVFSFFCALQEVEGQGVKEIASACWKESNASGSAVQDGPCAGRASVSVSYMIKKVTSGENTKTQRRKRCDNGLSTTACCHRNKSSICTRWKTPNFWLQSSFLKMQEIVQGSLPPPVFFSVEFVWWEVDCHVRLKIKQCVSAVNVLVFFMHIESRCHGKMYCSV